MTSASKAKGTRYETRVVNYLHKHLDERPERRALHGSLDKGDIFRVPAHGYEGIIECKAYSSPVTPKLIEEWRQETLDEKANAGADFAFLSIMAPNRAVGYSTVHISIPDLICICPGITAGPWGFERCVDLWVQMSLDEAIHMMGGDL